MNVDASRFKRQIDEACARYETNASVRSLRAEALGNLGQSGVLKKIESPERLVTRLRSVGQAHILDEVLSESRQLSSVRKLNLLERIIGEDDFLDARFLPLGAFKRRSVGRILESSSGFGFGTGFMISPVLMLTNNHVLADPNTASQSSIQFDYYERQSGVGETEIYSLKPVQFFETDEDLDFTIVAVETENDHGNRLARGWSPLIPESGKALVSERVNIIQHPDGGPQKLALRSNELIDVPGDFLHYVSDTKPGSSGSPVYNDQWELAALHHSGVPNRSENGDYLLTDGTVWDGSDSRIPDIDWIANEGVRISSIVSHLNLFVIPSLSQSQIALLEEVFSEVDPDLAFDEGGSMAGMDVGKRNGVRGLQQNGTNATWHIPLTVSIDLGGASAGSNFQDRVTGKPRTTRRNSYNIGNRASSSIESAAKERLNRFRDRPYYDEDTDFDNYEQYYAELPDSAFPEDWYRLFSGLVSRTHRTQLTYKKARLDYLYPWVDLHPTDSGSPTLQSIYSGEKFNPLSVISDELLNEQKRLETIREIRAGETVLSQERLEDQLELLEARFPFNCEHVVPQSWFGKRDPMKSDLHHLFTCEWGCNSFRSNDPYFDFSDFEEKVREKCGRSEDEGFEPEKGKGTVARATLYYLLRYPGRIRRAERSLVVERIQTLIDWHKEEPPEIYELHRNAAIFEIQGNRNPLIDWPEVVDFTEFAEFDT